MDDEEMDLDLDFVLAPLPPEPEPDTATGTGTEISNPQPVSDPGSDFWDDSIPVPPEVWEEVGLELYPLTQATDYMGTSSAAQAVADVGAVADMDTDIDVGTGEVDGGGKVASSPATGASIPPEQLRALAVEGLKAFLDMKADFNNNSNGLNSPQAGIGSRETTSKAAEQKRVNYDKNPGSKGRYNPKPIYARHEIEKAKEEARREVEGGKTFTDNEIDNYIETIKKRREKAILVRREKTLAPVNTASVGGASSQLAPAVTTFGVGNDENERIAGEGAVGAAKGGGSRYFTIAEGVFGFSRESGGGQKEKKGEQEGKETQEEEKKEEKEGGKKTDAPTPQQPPRRALGDITNGQTPQATAQATQAPPAPPTTQTPQALQTSQTPQPAPAPTTSTAPATTTESTSSKLPTGYSAFFTNRNQISDWPTLRQKHFLGLSNDELKKLFEYPETEMEDRGGRSKKRKKKGRRPRGYETHVFSSNEEQREEGQEKEQEEEEHGGDDDDGHDGVEGEDSDDDSTLTDLDDIPVDSSDDETISDAGSVRRYSYQQKEKWKATSTVGSLSPSASRPGSPELDRNPIVQAQIEQDRLLAESLQFEEDQAAVNNGEGDKDGDVEMEDAEHEHGKNDSRALSKTRKRSAKERSTSTPSLSRTTRRSKNFSTTSRLGSPSTRRYSYEAEKRRKCTQKARRTSRRATSTFNDEKSTVSSSGLDATTAENNETHTQQNVEDTTPVDAIRSLNLEDTAPSPPTGIPAPIDLSSHPLSILPPTHVRCLTQNHQIYPVPSSGSQTLREAFISQNIPLTTTCTICELEAPWFACWGGCGLFCCWDCLEWCESIGERLRAVLKFGHNKCMKLGREFPGYTVVKKIEVSESAVVEIREKQKEKRVEEAELILQAEVDMKPIIDKILEEEEAVITAMAIYKIAEEKKVSVLKVQSLVMGVEGKVMEYKREREEVRGRMLEKMKVMKKEAEVRGGEYVGVAKAALQEMGEGESQGDGARSQDNDESGTSSSITIPQITITSKTNSPFTHTHLEESTTNTQNHANPSTCSICLTDLPATGGILYQCLLCGIHVCAPTFTNDGETGCYEWLVREFVAKRRIGAAEMKEKEREGVFMGVWEKKERERGWMQTLRERVAQMAGWGWREVGDDLEER